MDFTREEKKIRKNWLISTTILYLVIPFIGGMSIFFKTNELSSQNLGWLIVYFFSFLILYYYAYKKNGTHLLTLFLIILPIYLFIDFVQSVINGQLSFKVVFYIWWYIASLKLRKINTKLKKIPTLV